LAYIQLVIRCAVSSRSVLHTHLCCPESWADHAECTVQRCTSVAWCQGMASAMQLYDLQVVWCTGPQLPACWRGTAAAAATVAGTAAGAALTFQICAAELQGRTDAGSPRWTRSCPHEALTPLYCTNRWWMRRASSRQGCHQLARGCSGKALHDVICHMSEYGPEEVGRHPSRSIRVG
jgi:hypothetical protein